MQSPSKGALAITNMTFNEEVPLAERSPELKKGQPYGSTAFYQSQKRRFDRIK